MPTIFIKNLKQLIAGHLKLRWSDLKAQETAYNYGPIKLTSMIHDVTLSIEQAKIVAELEVKIITFSGVGTDEEDKDFIKKLIADAQLKVEKVRVDHDATATSDTLNCLQYVSNMTESFYMQLKALTPTFAFLDIPVKATPEYVVYEHACNYLGLAKFYPDTHGSIETRKLKEAALFNRLDLLKKTIQPQHTLEEQRTFVLDALTNLGRDNIEIVRPKKAVSIPFFSAGATIIGIPVKAQTTSVGTLEHAIELATKEVNEMKVSDCPRERSVMAPLLVKAPLVEVPEEKSKAKVVKPTVASGKPKAVVKSATQQELIAAEILHREEEEPLVGAGDGVHHEDEEDIVDVEHVHEADEDEDEDLSHSRRSSL